MSSSAIGSLAHEPAVLILSEAGEVTLNSRRREPSARILTHQSNVETFLDGSFRQHIGSAGARASVPLRPVLAL
jgi:hypothetical protein